MKLTLITFLLSVIYVNGQTILINEFMSKNDTTINDDDGDFSDWIELYNTSDTAVNMLNYNLSDDDDNLNKWTFPEIIISPHGYLLIFASDKNRLDTTELHTNFRISSSGEKLYLSNNLGTIIDQTNSINLNSDEAYARITDADPRWAKTKTPTPRSSNTFSTGIYNSHPSGFYDNSFQLELIKLNENQEIHYTLNGGIPSSNSPLYTSPIIINNNSQTQYSISGIPTTPLSGPDQLYDFIWEEPTSVYKCNTIRYAAFEGENRESEIYSKTYFVDPAINARYEMPIISLVTDSLNLFDYDTGIYIPGKSFDEEGFSWWPNGNYHNRGELWERDVHITFIKDSGQIGFETNAGIRMRGYGSTCFPQKSFNIYFRNEYGINKTSYPIFNNPEVEYHKRFILRNSGNDVIYSHFKDAMLHEVMSTMDLEKQDFQPSITFINGEYWGIYNLREKYDRHYFKYKYNIPEDSINLLGVCGMIEEGDNSDYMNLYNFVEQNDLSYNENYFYVSEKLDINNFIDFQIAEIYFANYDWPCNNYKIWKDNQANSKWRFLIYDLDYSFGVEQFNNNAVYSTASMEHATSTENDWPYCECSNLLFRKLLQNEDFKNLFISKFSDHLKTTFDTDRIIGIINEFESLYTNEIEEHIDRWSYPNSKTSWENEVEKLRVFAKERPCYMDINIGSFFNLSYSIADELDCAKQNSNNSLILVPNPNNGDLFLLNTSDEDIINAKITITNLNGQKVYQEYNIDLLRNERKYFNLSKLDNNMYIIKVASSNFFEQIKMIIIK